jgi:potassium/chloride transporter 9
MTDVNEEPARPMPPRSRSNFAAKTATDTSQRLHRRSFAQSSPPPNERTPLLDGGQDEHVHEEEHGVEWLRSWFCNTFHLSRSKSSSSSSSQDGRRRTTSDVSKPRPGAFPRPVGGTDKLGTFAGVFVPVTLNVLSILMFLRFGFILGQTGVVGMMGKIVPMRHRQRSSQSLLKFHVPVASSQL